MGHDGLGFGHLRLGHELWVQGLASMDPDVGVEIDSPAPMDAGPSARDRVLFEGFAVVPKETFKPSCNGTLISFGQP